MAVQGCPPPLLGCSSTSWGRGRRWPEQRGPCCPSGSELGSPSPLPCGRDRHRPEPERPAVLTRCSGKSSASVYGRACVRVCVCELELAGEAGRGGAARVLFKQPAAGPLGLGSEVAPGGTGGVVARAPRRPAWAPSALTGAWRLLQELWTSVSEGSPTQTEARGAAGLGWGVQLPWAVGARAVG